MPLFHSSKRSDRRDKPPNTVWAPQPSYPIDYRPPTREPPINTLWAPQPSYPIDFRQLNQPPTHKSHVTSHGIGARRSANRQNYNDNNSGQRDPTSTNNGAGLWQGMPNASPPMGKHSSARQYPEGYVPRTNHSTQPTTTGHVNPTRNASGRRSSRPRALSTRITSPQMPRVQPQNTCNNFGNNSDPRTTNTSFASNTYGRNGIDQFNQPYSTTPPRN